MCRSITEQRNFNTCSPYDVAAILRGAAPHSLVVLLLRTIRYFCLTWTGVFFPFLVSGHSHTNTILLLQTLQQRALPD